MITIDQDKLAAINSAKLLALAEAHVAQHFSTVRLLQMKVWWDQFPHEDVPKLSAVFDWTASITIKAAQGNTDFGNPPHIFEELLVEAMDVLGVNAPAPAPAPAPEPEP